jgi:hypothetical protein
MLGGTAQEETRAPDHMTSTADKASIVHRELMDQLTAHQENSSLTNTKPTAKFVQLDTFASADTLC